jgi:hypothetical protein
MNSTPRMAALATFLVIATATSVYAQQPQAVRGTIDKIDGGIVSIKQANGADVDVQLLDSAKVFGVQAATIADVKPNDFIGVGAMPQPDGSQKAIQVTIFAESQRGTGEGFGPWDRPGATMTNGTADNTVASVNGQVVMVKYKGGEQKIIIGPDARHQGRTQTRRSCVGRPSRESARWLAANRAHQRRHRQYGAVIE